MGERLNIPIPENPWDLTILLVETENSGNLGAVARVMMNLGFNDLRLLSPVAEIDVEALSRAKHARSVLENAKIYDTWDDATSDASLVVGSSGKRETGKRVVFREFILPWDLVSDVSERGSGRIILVFGPEGVGLNHNLLESCDLLLTIPTWEGYPVLNLSHSVGICLWEFHRERVKLRQGIDDGLPNVVPPREPLDPIMRRMLKGALNAYGSALPGVEPRRVGVKRTLSRVIFRSLPYPREAHRLMGAFVDGTSALRHVGGDERWMRDRARRYEAEDE